MTIDMNDMRKWEHRDGHKHVLAKNRQGWYIEEPKCQVGQTRMFMIVKVNKVYPQAKSKRKHAPCPQSSSLWHPQETIREWTINKEIIIDNTQRKISQSSLNKF